jgi:hypothetical protein|tara:strand:+ start:1565 stop:2851 length:1287 start_codon:yes stop_codon:yes gene_type:complete
MGSAFIPLNRITSEQRKLFGDTRPRPVYVQFVPGIVGQVVTSNESLSYDGVTRKINSILAKSHIGDKLKKTSLLDEEDRYYPLLRGITDVPAVGDPIMLCTIGGVQYYLGPLNTVNNPNFNIDHLETQELNVSSMIGSRSKTTERERIGLSKNFKRLPKLSRMQKLLNDQLDDPKNKDKVSKEIHGDLLFEGRHGNSIRIGSRNINPYIFISNGRNQTNIAESLSDGTTIALIESGTVRQHFNNDFKIENKDVVVDPWVLSSDTVEDSSRLISSLVSNVNGGIDAEDKIYSYSENQLFQRSHRIVIDSKTESIFVSSFQNIHIGAGGSLTISTNRETIIESENIFLGLKSKEDEERQGIIIGENLRSLLEELVDILSKANGHCQGAPVPAGFNNGAPGTMIKELAKIQKKLSKGSNNFVSTKHFIEQG